MVDRISRRNFMWWYFNVYIDIRIQYEGIPSLNTTHTQVEQSRLCGNDKKEVLVTRLVWP